MELSEILRRLGVVTREKRKAIRDGMRLGMTHLLLFADGSGEVRAEWIKHNEGMCKEEKTLHAIFSEEGPIFEFNKVEELETWLVEQSGGN